MSDAVVVLAKSFTLAAWIAEGDPAGEPWSGQEWDWGMGGHAPTRIQPGDRVYVVYAGKLRGYAPLIRIDRFTTGDVHGFALVRGGGAVAVTIPETIPSFRGFRYRWWPLELERPFPEWRTP